MSRTRRPFFISTFLSAFLSALWLAALGLANLPVTMEFAQATSFMERPFPTTVGEAPIIARGKVGMSYTNWVISPEGSKRIYTFYELNISEVFKGKLDGATTVIRELGGEKDGVGLQIPGTAHFSRGEDVVVMLGDANPDDSHDIRGMMMGKYNVEKDADGKEILRGPGLSGRSGAIRHDHDEAEGQDGPSSVKKWTLETLRDVIRDQAEGKTPIPASSQMRISPSPAPGSAVATHPTTVSVKASDSPAPVLQPSSPDQGAVDPGDAGWPAMTWVAIAGMVIVAGAWFALKNSK